MINSLIPIDVREYYLYDDTRSKFHKYHYREVFKHYSLVRTDHHISLSEIDSFIKDSTFLKLFQSKILTEAEHFFWKHTTPEMKRSLLFSFYLRFVKQQKKMPNVQTENWLLHPMFRTLHETLLQTTRFRNITRPKELVSAMIRTSGKHKINLRMGHIHLTFDELDTKLVPTIHWDVSVVNIDTKDILRHWIHDDIPS